MQSPGIMRIFSTYAAKLQFALPFAVLGIISSCGRDGGDNTTQSESEPAIAAPGETVAGLGQAPPFRLVSMGGEEIAMEDYKGKVVFINFWATWCAPCRLEIPDFISLQEEYGDRGFQVLGVALDEDGLEKVRSYAEEIGINYPIVFDDYTLANKLGGVFAMPSTYMIDANGIIRGRKIGYFPEEEMEEKLQTLLDVNREGL